MASEIVHVIDDDDAVRESIAFLFESAGMESRSYPSAEAYLDACGGNGEGCIVTDVRMPGMGGVGLLRRVSESGSRIPVVVITGHADVPLAVEAMKLGAVDFIEKPFDDEVLIRSVRGALVRAQQEDEAETAAAEAAARIAALSPRERDVLQGLVAGKPNKMIAFDLGISVRTVEVYRANLMTKLQASSLSDVVRLALLAEGAARER